MDETQPPSCCKKILIIRFSSIGDIVLTTPVVRAIKEQVKPVEIHYLTKKENENILIPNPHITKVHTFCGSIQSCITELNGEHFDYIVDLQKNKKSKKICHALHVPWSTFNKHNIKKWIFVNLKINLLPNQHIVNLYFDAVKPLQVQNDHKGLEYYIPKKEEFDKLDLPIVFEDGFVAVVLGSIHGTKRIPAQKIIEIATILHKPIMLLGGKDVIFTAEEIVARLGERAYNGCGRFSLHQSASIIKQSNCVLTGDTGLMHISAALHKPIASLWGNTVPEFGMYPYLPGEPFLFRVFEICTLSCRPCSKLGFKKCPKKHYKCMNSISAVEVAEWINQFQE
ncbi:MAG: glycosyltransferase family 9 protein [Bacteroidales bacterium]